MDIIELAREFGAKIQEDERYLNLKMATQINENDENLQALINEFNLKRVSVSHELSKSVHDEGKIKLLNEDLQKCYNDLMKNKNIINYNRRKAEFDELMKKINSIILGCANGENPKTVDISERSCAVDCSACAGCS